MQHSRGDVMQHRFRKVSGIGYGTILLTLGLFAVGHAYAASIPVWLDDAIAVWNSENADIPITFVDIKDSYVWYTIPVNPEFGQQEIRERIFKIVSANGYQRTDEEELITTGRPPSPTGPSREKKCWKRSFVLNIDELSNTTAVGGPRSGQRQRMLTSMVCQDTQQWLTGFRILQ
jgi:hypothetical protein